jgi:hypothetical protein
MLAGLECVVVDDWQPYDNGHGITACTNARECEAIRGSAGDRHIDIELDFEGYLFIIRRNRQEAIEQNPYPDTLTRRSTACAYERDEAMNSLVGDQVKKSSLLKLRHV